ncbi:MAG: ParB/RepB/Spo0J family partition protein [Proteobacteria bacterium]|nr:ParB/RepB/Spo0J family partition protein [Pseudomonadota bacterium]
MTPEFQEVPLETVSGSDITFRISGTNGENRWVGIIREAGLLAPVLLRERQDGRFQVVDGFSRREACRELGCSPVPAMVLPLSTPDGVCAFAAVSLNAVARPLGLLETSRAIALLGPDLAWDARQDLVRRALGLEAPIPRLKDWESLCRMPATLQEALEAGALAFPVALDLGRLEESNAKALARLFLELPQSLSRQRQILSLVREIAERENLSPAQVLEDPGIGAAIREEKDKNAAATRVRAILHQRRYPTVDRETAERDRLVAGLRLPPRMKWEPPPFFEGTTHVLRLQFDSEKELSQHLSRTLDLLKNPALKRVMGE